MAETTNCGPQTITTRDPRLIVISDVPENAETPLRAQQGVVTPTPLFFRRNRFEMPRLSGSDWTLDVEGRVHRPLRLRLPDILDLPSHSVVATLECAGNGRTGLSPVPAGEPWGYGAVSTAEWTGISLSALLERAGLDASVQEIVCEGADAGLLPDPVTRTSFARSLPLERALHPDTLLAFGMNGKNLPLEHGYPLRLIVPGWYGMASVKWLTRITAIDHLFDGFFQAARYVMIGDGRPSPVPLRETRIRSLIVEPAEEDCVRVGPITVAGYAWSGAAPVSRVEISTDGGAAWDAARWATEATRYAWRRWEYLWSPVLPGQVTLKSRATDAAGNTQPEIGEWNELGYANNAIQSVTVEVK